MRQFLEDTIRAAGALSLEYRSRLSSVAVDSKTHSQKDLVTEADRAVENLIVSRITETYPDHAILGEETGSHDGSDYRWIIDPIDGTTSFVHNQPFYSVSIGVEHQGRDVLAAVCLPVLDELFVAEAGGGAELNGEPIRVSERSRLIDSTLATGFACVRANHEPNNIPIFAEVMKHVRGIRRYGSAAADLCYVACGRLEAFWEMALQPYDVAAGRLIVTEAGGTFTDFVGGTEHLDYETLATNGRITTELVEVLSVLRARQVRT
ncbi:MAG: inositol monophosphatase [Planctomycetes bacterium]|nr:inositol monophosphatase [Phycisphaerae bacterium]NBB94959.1 inositol monophosphatase [Planctomycetota bacterium]